MRVLLDSCILIDFLSGRAAARAYLAELDGAAISLVTWMEVVVGATTAEEEAVVRTFLSGFVLLPVEGEVAEEAVALRRAKRLKLPDAIILASARVHGLVLATRNTKDFDATDAGVLVPYEV
ncbi:MAG: type II toxin-antitoxin system VapC family toxin [Alphaproteobacteria bacterium]|nr:type II toxin-antitoxin system VapC family toxin [Alphaproteobacteria bacterium]